MPVRRRGSCYASNSVLRKQRRRAERGAVASSFGRGTRYAGPSSDSPLGSALGLSSSSRLQTPARVRGARRATLGIPAPSEAAARATNARERPPQLRVCPGRRGCPRQPLSAASAAPARCGEAASEDCGVEDTRADHKQRCRRSAHHDATQGARSSRAHQASVCVSGQRSAHRAARC